MYQYSSNRRDFRHGPSKRNGFRGNSQGYSRPPQQSRRKLSTLEGQVDIFIKKSVITSTTPETSPDNATATDFLSWNLNPQLLANITKKGYQTPTPVQEAAIGPILEGKDIIALASTGTGKTGAFLIPVINHLFADKTKKAFIVAPTRELAVQIDDEFRSLASGLHLFSSLAIGGAYIGNQVYNIRKGVNMVVGTPGRMKELIQMGVLRPSQFSIFILDEVDLMVDIGFINDIRGFISLLPPNRQSLFFSATLSHKVRPIVDSFVKNPVSISLKKRDTSENVDQDVVRVGNRNKIDLLHDLLIKPDMKKVLIFGRTKHSVDKLHRELAARGFSAGAIHGNKTQGQRQRILSTFKQNQIRILLATDVASRGLDIDNVSHVINYELPETYDDYIHRIGRTGRAGKTGIALTFVP